MRTAAHKAYPRAASHWTRFSAKSYRAPVIATVATNHMATS